MAVQPIPEGYHTLTSVLAVNDAAGAIEFYKRAFGATERMRMPTPDGKIAHAEIEIGDSLVMLSDPMPGSSMTAPDQLGGTSAGLFVYVEDVDASFQRALDAGATELSALQDMFWGDRFGSLTDPYGHIWSLATHKQDLSEEEIAEGAKAAMAAMGSS